MSETSVANDGRRFYLRPLSVPLGLSFVGELGIWVIWGSLRSGARVSVGSACEALGAGSGME